MLLTFLQKQLRKLNGISSHLKRKRKEEEKKTNGDKKRKRDEDDEDRSTYELDTTRFRESIARKILENFDGLTKSTMEKLKLYFENVCSGTCETMSRSQTSGDENARGAKSTRVTVERRRSNRVR